MLITCFRAVEKSWNGKNCDAHQPARTAVVSATINELGANTPHFVFHCEVIPILKIARSGDNIENVVLVTENFVKASRDARQVKASRGEIGWLENVNQGIGPLHIGGHRYNRQARDFFREDISEDVKAEELARSLEK